MGHGIKHDKGLGGMGVQVQQTVEGFDAQRLGANEEVPLD